jgi:hypothetical protein
VAALVGIGALVAHGGLAGAVVEAAAALLIVAIALAVWLGGRKDGEQR